MVNKLFKHEIYTYLRILPFVYGIVLIIALFGRIYQFFEVDEPVFYIGMGSAVLVYYLAILVCLSFNSIYTIVRFYKNLFTGEGYLTFTLPATPNQLLLVKLGTAFLFDIISCVVVFISLVIFTFGKLSYEIGDAARFLLGDLFKEIGHNVVIFGAEILAIFAVSFIFGHLVMFSCICIGQLFKKNRILASVGVYFVYYIVSQICSTIIMMFTSIVVPLLPEEILNKVGELIDAHPFIFTHSLFCSVLIGSVVMAGVLYLLCNRIMTKRLNLE